MAEATKMWDWEPPMPPTDLIFDDGEPLETNRHRIAMNTLIRSLQQAWCNSAFESNTSPKSLRAGNSFGVGK
jgi:hypothetical protein